MKVNYLFAKIVPLLEISSFCPFANEKSHKIREEKYSLHFSTGVLGSTI